MTPQQKSYAEDIQNMLIDCKRRLNAAADRGDIREMGRLAYQYTSLSRLLEAAS